MHAFACLYMLPLLLLLLVNHKLNQRSKIGNTFGSNTRMTHTPRCQFAAAKICHSC